MTLRFRYRHVHATLYLYVRTRMTALGWGDASKPGSDPVNAAINFQVPPMTFKDFQPDEAGETIAPQTLVITLGGEPAREDMELGAGLVQIPYAFYIDIYGYSQAAAQSVMSDLKDILEDIAIPIKDFTQAPPVDTDGVIEIFHEDIESARPDASVGAQDFKRYWRTLATIARAEYLV